MVYTSLNTTNLLAADELLVQMNFDNLPTNILYIGLVNGIMNTSLGSLGFLTSIIYEVNDTGLRALFCEGLTTAIIVPKNKYHFFLTLIVETKKVKHVMFFHFFK